MDRKQNMKKIAGWLDGQEKQKDGWMDIKNVWIERKMDGWMDRWLKQIDGWLDEGKHIKKLTYRKKYEKIDGWLDEQKQQMDGWMDGQKTNQMIQKLLEDWMDRKNRWMAGWI